jgi:Uma2 family endonuclease
MEAILEPLVHSPKLSLYLEQLQGIVSDEQARRQRFYAEITEDQKAEFINGEIVIQSPAKLEHNRASVLLLRLLSTYVSVHQLGFVGHEKMLISLTRNDYEPDICFFLKSKADEFIQEQWQFPTPDFIVEVLSLSTEDIDRTIKFEDYAAHGVGEYWIIDPDAETVEQYVLTGDVYKLLLKVQTGTIRSRVIAGFEISVRAIFDEQENLRVLQTFLMDGRKE